MEGQVLPSSSASSPSPKHTSLPVELPLALGIAVEQELGNQPHLGGTAGEVQTLPLQLSTCRAVVDSDEHAPPVELLLALTKTMGDEGTLHGVVMLATVLVVALPAAVVMPAGVLKRTGDVLERTGELKPTVVTIPAAVVMPAGVHKRTGDVLERIGELKLTCVFRFLGVLEFTGVLRFTGVLSLTGVPSSGLLGEVGEEHTQLAVVPVGVGGSIVMHGTDATWSWPLSIRWPSSGVVGSERLCFGISRLVEQLLKSGDEHRCRGRVEQHRERGVVLGELACCLVSTQASRIAPVEW